MIDATGSQALRMSYGMTVYLTFLRGKASLQRLNELLARVRHPTSILLLLPE